MIAPLPEPGEPNDQGLYGPVAGSPPRLPGTVRRTTSLDLAWPEGPYGPMTLTGRARDQLTHQDGSTGVHDSAMLTATVVDGVVTAMRTHPDADRTAALVGRKLAVGFRTAVWRTVRDHYDAGTPLHQLLDEMPISLIIGGFSRRRADPSLISSSKRRLDVCSGWAEGGYAAAHREEHGRPPVPHLWPAPELVSPTDPAGWHTLPEIPRWGMTRRRRIDVLPLDEGAAVEGLFRDSWRDGDGEQQVLHEYEFHAQVDGAGKIREIRTVPHVLPHLDCPAAAASSRGIRGAAADQLREYVSMNLFGPASCTHLNDVLRSLADVGRLGDIARAKA